MPLALTQARVDSAFPAEPFITMSSASSRVVGNAYNSIARRFTIGVWVTTTQWAQSHPDLVAKFAQVLDKTAAWANAHHDESSAVLVKYAKLDPTIAKTMLRVQYAPRLVPREMQPILDLATHYGALPSTVEADQLVYKA
jgi:NitT/TauT family transport system substrate-binding protein